MVLSRHPDTARELVTWAASIGEPLEVRPLDAASEGEPPRMVVLGPDAILGAVSGPAQAAAVEAARLAGALVTCSLLGWSGADQGAGAGAAYAVARLGPEILIVEPPGAKALAVPLEGLAKVPVVWRDGIGCDVFGRSVPAPTSGWTGGGAAFAIAFCAAYLEGATPLEAAGRAVIVAAAAGVASAD